MFYWFLPLALNWAALETFEMYVLLQDIEY